MIKKAFLFEDSVHLSPGEVGEHVVQLIEEFARQTTGIMHLPPISTGVYEEGEFTCDATCEKITDDEDKLSSMGMSRLPLTIKEKAFVLDIISERYFIFEHLEAALDDIEDEEILSYALEIYDRLEKAELNL